ncbi:MAG: hypothetical protein LC775_14325, partial [Acidobacteria bacterium]|nr:hypothetical protein [Acidobacteriota bacterium]
AADERYYPSKTARRGIPVGPPLGIFRGALEQRSHLSYCLDGWGHLSVWNEWRCPWGDVMDDLDHGPSLVPVRKYARPFLNYNGASRKVAARDAI